MKKYLIEPYVEQTYSLVIGQNVSNTTDVTRSATYSFALNDTNPIDSNAGLQGNIGLNINDANSQILSNTLLNGQTAPSTTFSSRYTNPVISTNPLYPIGSDNIPTTRLYRIEPTVPPVIIPITSNYNLVFFIIAIVIILIILIIFYFVL